MKIITKFKLFWAWQDEEEEAWLHAMSTRGLHLQALPFPTIYKFEVDNPRNDYYRMDYIVDKKDYLNYLQLFRDTGWEHIGEMGGWQYFRTAAEGSSIPEIYTDNDSKAQKYQRLITILIVFLPVFLATSIGKVDPSSRFAGLYLAGKLINSILLLLYTFALIMIFKRIRELKHK